MAYIRNRNEERTGYQSGSFYTPSVDNQCDFIMVYRLDDSSEKRVREYREKGYVIHFMTGISWGSYLDYLNGELRSRKTDTETRLSTVSTFRIWFPPWLLRITFP